MYESWKNLDCFGYTLFSHNQDGSVYMCGFNQRFFSELGNLNFISFYRQTTVEKQFSLGNKLVDEYEWICSYRLDFKLNNLFTLEVL